MKYLPADLAAYKRFIGGSSSYKIEVTGGMYGMAAPPGIQEVGSTGISLMVNATMPFFLFQGDKAQPPSFPVRPQPFRFNLLLLSNRSAVVLDTPRKEYLVAIQDKLAPNEERMVEASVHGTVTNFDESVIARQNDSAYWKAHYDIGDFVSIYLFNEWSVALLSETSTVFLAVASTPSGIL